MTVIQEAMFQTPHLPLAVTQVSKETVKAFSHSKRVGGYLLGRTLGVGSFAKVKESLHLATGEKAAVKIIDKQRAKTDSYVRKNLRREGKLLQAVRHPNIVALLEIMETDNSYYLVTELCRGGDLMDYISARKRLQENEVLKFIRQIVSAVDYLHKLGIIHRDLKIENLLLDNNKDIKLIDFGLSNFVKVLTDSEGTRATELCSTQCGSPAYAAPELLNHEQYGLQVDSWSVGVNMFAMLTGSLPFTVEPFNIKTLYVKMRDRQMNPVPDGLSRECRDLLRKFLTPDPAKRVTIEQAMVHPWLTQGNTQPIKRVPCPNKLRAADINTDILSHMTDNLGFRMGEVIKFVTCNTPSSACATYHLYLRRLERYQVQKKQRSKTSMTSLKKISVDDINSLVPDASRVTNANSNITTTVNNASSSDAASVNNDNEKDDQHRAMSESAASSPSPYLRRTPIANLAGPTTTQTTNGDELNGESSDRKENKNPLDEDDSRPSDNEDKPVSPPPTGGHSPRPTNRPVLKRSLQEVKSATPTPVTATTVTNGHHLSDKPRLYKRRGEPPSTRFPEEFTPAPVSVVDLKRNLTNTPRGDGRVEIVSLKERTSQQSKPESIIGSLASGRNGGAIHPIEEHSSPIAAIPHKPQLSDQRHQGMSERKAVAMNDKTTGSLTGNPQDRPRRYIQNKNAAMHNRRASLLKTVEIKAEPGGPADSARTGTAIRTRLQDIQNVGRGAAGMTTPGGAATGNSGQPAVQAYRIIPRPFVPFRSAHHVDRSAGGATDALQRHHFRPSQKSRTAEALTLRRDDVFTSAATTAATVSSQYVPASNNPADNDSPPTAPTTSPSRPVIVRKRLAKRHRLGGVGSMQVGLIHDIEQAVTTSPLTLLSSSHDAGVAGSARTQGQLGVKSPRVINGESLPAVRHSHAKS